MESVTFNFLRPAWLLALIPMLVLLWQLWRQQTQQSGWKSLLPQAYQPYLLNDNTQVRQSTPWGLIGLALIWLLSVIALAGPNWHSKAVPAQPTQSASIILLDLSLSMYADDISPNRITRAQFKINDFLQQNRHLQIGMVAYSGSAHVISPISQDPGMLLNVLPHLNPRMMPAYGADAISGFKQAQRLLDGAQITQGHIIWITDDVEVEEIEPIKRLLAQHDIALSVIAVGTEIGGAINVPNHGLLRDEQERVVQATVPVNRLAQLARDSGGRFSLLQLDDSDLAVMRPPFLPQQTQQDEDNPVMMQALDYGIYLLWLLVPLVALSVRRGWALNLAAFSLLPLILLSSPTVVYAEQNQNAQNTQGVSFSERWRQLYLSGDQRGYQAWQQQDWLSAEREFNDPAWRGQALYKQHRYQEAAQAFAQQGGAEGFFNQGNALVKSGALEQAKQAYVNALQLDPNLQAAKQNLALVEQALQQAQSPQAEAAQQGGLSQADPDQPSQDPARQEQDSDGEDEEDGRPQSHDDAQQQDADAQQSQAMNEDEAQHSNQAPAAQTDDNIDPSETSASRPQQQDLNDDLAAQDAQSQDLDAGQLTERELETAQDEAAAPELSREQREQMQADHAWLNQIRDEPGIFLQRKFEFQYQQNTQQRNTTQPQGKQW